jgi:hypothetical protein
LLAVISLIPGLFCLGLWGAFVLPSLVKEKPASSQSNWRLIALIFASGMLLNYVTLLICGSLPVAMSLDAIGAICGLGLLVLQGRQHIGRFCRGELGPVLLFMVAAVILCVTVLLVPLYTWDARSIWFFHGKMIYFTQGLTRNSGLALPSFTFSHPDYPNLVPMLAGEVATMAGFWNEQLPKFSLLLVLIPIVAVTLSYWRKPFAFIALIALVWMKLIPDVSNGYMDALMAIYGLFAVMLIGSWLARASLLDLATGICFVGITFGLKNEGILVAMTIIGCGLLAVLLAMWVEIPLPPLNWPQWIGIGALLLLCVACLAIWQIKRNMWGLENDLRIGLGSLPIIQRRLADPEAVKQILQATVLDNGLVYAVCMSCIAMGLAWLFRAGHLCEQLFCFSAGIVYLVGIQVIYLATTRELPWHLMTSCGRTTFLPVLLCMTPVFLVLRDENLWQLPQEPADRKPQPPPQPFEDLS